MGFLLAAKGKNERMRELRNLWTDEKGQVAWPGLVTALIIAFLAIVVYKVMFS